MKEENKEERDKQKIIIFFFKNEVERRTAQAAKVHMA